MPNPILTFGFVIATLYGAIFHLIFGGGARRLSSFIGASWLGFAIGHFSGDWFDVQLFVIGALNFSSASFGALLALVITYVLTQPNSQNRNNAG